MKNLRANILRGKDKIGENLIEVTDGKSKILLECGVALEPTEKSREIETKVLNSNYDAIIITHYHLDHSALLKNPLNTKKIFISKGAFNVLEYCNAISKENKNRVEFLQDQKIFSVGEIKCKPYLCDHSAFDSYMIEIEKGGEIILYTGDFRSNGRKNYQNLLNKLSKMVDLLIIEGTNIISKNLTEKELEEKAIDIFSKHNKVFILQSTLNIDRTVSFYRASKRTNKPFIMGISSADICSNIKNIPNPKTFDSCYTYLNRAVDNDCYTKTKENYQTKLLGRGQISKMEKFTMQINSNMLKYLQKLSVITSLQDSILIYSMWQGYKPKMQQFLEGVKVLGIKVVDLHTSGHADIAAIKKLIQSVNPEEIEFVHTEKDSWSLFEKTFHLLKTHNSPLA